jgi:site-specific recombinase XerD
MGDRKTRTRGVYEKVSGSGIWWIHYYDAEGRRRREKVGSKSNALKLYHKRKTEVLQGIKLPENFRARAVKFGEIAEAALEYSRTEKTNSRQDEYRMAPIVERFGNCPAESILPEQMEHWLDAQTVDRGWAPATRNRYIALLKLVYRLAERNRKIKTNPARLLRMRKENNARIRYLNQYSPTETKIDYLRGCGDEESRLRAVIEKDYPDHLPEFVVALHTGMRPSEQYGLTWDRVNLPQQHITIPRSKNGKTRYVRLNSAAVGALKSLQRRSISNAGPVFVTMQGEPLRGYRHWFDPAVRRAGIKDFTWYCLRHTFASRLAMAGVDLRTLVELMGHQSIQMTMRYAHLGPSHTLAAVERLVLVPSLAEQSTDRRSHSAVTATRTATGSQDPATGLSVGIN